jgi:hypothetical protein
MGEADEQPQQRVQQEQAHQAPRQDGAWLRRQDVHCGPAARQEQRHIAG